MKTNYPWIPEPDSPESEAPKKSVPVTILCRQMNMQRAAAYYVNKHMARLSADVPDLLHVDVVIERTETGDPSDPCFKVQLRLHLDGERILAITHAGGCHSVDTALGQAFRKARRQVLPSKASPNDAFESRHTHDTPH